MREISPFNFGLVVAYLVPGFVVQWGLSYHSETVRAWLSVAPENAATVGDILYATLASVAAGMIVSALRWAVIDTLHSLMGLSQPPLDFSLLAGRLEAYQTLVEMHYRYYQFYANMLVALVFAYAARRTAVSGWADQWGAVDVGLVVVCVVLFLGSRDALRLCGSAHKASYVAKMVMWRRSKWPAVLRYRGWIERHITNWATAFVGTPSAPCLSSMEQSSSSLELHTWPMPWPSSPDPLRRTHWSSSATRARATHGSC